MKEKEKGEDNMCEIIDKLREESRHTALSIAKLYYKGNTIDQIVLTLNLPREEVEKD
ncbi:MAG: hypothetical protein J5981_05490 [Lachnospira sp.]|nr:hypothetical protein [Lachnospira sp.]